MKTLNIASVAINQTALDFKGNLERLTNAVKEARDGGAKLITFPEMAITGYGCDDAWLYPRNIRRAWECLILFADECEDVIVSVGLPVQYNGQLYNGVALIVDTEILGIVAKQNLAGDGLHYEPRWFKPWKKGTWDNTDYSLYDHNLRIGDLKFDINGLTIGFEICEEAWVPNRTGSSLNTDIIINPSASHTQFDKPSARLSMVKEASRNFACTYIYTNLLGNSSGRAIYDGDSIIAYNGNIIADGERFSMADYVITYASIDPEPARMTRRKIFTNNQNDSTTKIKDYDFNWSGDSKIYDSVYSDRDIFCRNEHFLLAITLGLFDYMRKTKSYGYVISLSGGADSSLCAILVAEMISRITNNRRFIEKIGYIPIMWGDSYTNNMLTCVYQGNDGISSETTRNAAKELAKNLNSGAKFHEIDITSLVNEYRNQVETCIERELNWEDDDIALQNLQARVRAPSVWALANIENKILLTTSNRSEAGVGYASMDGDTCGGLAPISGIDKSFIIDWLNWYKDEYINYHKGNDHIRNALSLVLNQRPTAELRPDEQMDEYDLMPYDVLRTIEYEAILNGRSPEDIIQMLGGTELDVHYVHKFFKLWYRNQWKRERYAPGFHIDHLSLCPKTFTRFPILSGQPDVQN